MLLSKIWLVLKLVAVLLVFITSGWFLQQPLLNQILISFAIFSLLVHLKFKTFPFKFIFLICFLALTYIQISSTDVRNTYRLNDHQKYINQNHLDQYPSSLVRLGNIIENRLDSPTIYQIRQNFFDSFDFVNYFKNLYLTILFIPFLLGLYKFLKHPDNLITATAAFSLLLLTIIGAHGSYGPILMFPFITIIISHYSCEK